MSRDAGSALPARHPRRPPPPPPGTEGLLLPGERLPRGGLPHQLGHVGGGHTQFSLAELRARRAEAKDAATVALSHVVSHALERVRDTGAA
eukprot:222402-Chlamydomonas_euryale.AAC.1